MLPAIAAVGLLGRTKWGDTTNVWTSIIQNTNAYSRQISVLLKNGTELECNDVSLFKDAAFPGYYTDNVGNIAIYVTKMTPLNGKPEEREYVTVENWGDLITYIPKSEISTVDIRLEKK